MRHSRFCRWQETKESECEYRKTHEYCPHPNHACDCQDSPPAPEARVDWDKVVDGIPLFQLDLGTTIKVRAMILKIIQSAFEKGREER